MAANIEQRNLSNTRATWRGVLVGVLLLLVAFSFCWYVLEPGKYISLVKADAAEASLVADIDPFYVLLIGSDSRRGTSLYTGNAFEEGQVNINADILTLVRIDPAERVLTFLSIPRDTASVSSSAKICTRLTEGDPTRVIHEAEKITKVEINNYVMVSFTGFENIVDFLDGIYVDVPTAAVILDPSTGREVRVDAGPDQLLDGSHALAVASAWDNANELEPLRQACVRAIERGILSKIADRDEDFIRRVVTVFNSNVKTNIDDSLLISIALDYANNASVYTIYAGTGPYQGAFNARGEWVVARDSATWAACMEVVDAGGDPNSVVVSFLSGQ